MTKNGFTSLDLAAAVHELKGLEGQRVNQIYDIDHKTYILKLQKPNEKSVLLIESGTRIHTTTYAWTKNVYPSGFTMKLRKHLTNKRLESISQLGTDRVVIMRFGSDAAAHFLMVELFHRGNIVLTDYSMKILSVLTPHKETHIRFAVGETYPANRSKINSTIRSVGELKEIAEKAPSSDTIFRTILPRLDLGSALMEHAFLNSGLSKSTKFSEKISDEQLTQLVENLREAENILHEASIKPSKGYIIKNIATNVENQEIETFIDFHPFLFTQHKNSLYNEYETFNLAVDEYFSKKQSQSLEIKAMQMEKEIINKVEKIRQNQSSRLQDLTIKQEEDRKKAELIACNSDIVQEAIININSAIASQMSWDSIETLVRNAQLQGEPVAQIIHSLNLQINHITLVLSDQYNEIEEGKPTLVEVDLALSAHANAKQYYDHKKHAALKEKKTLEAQDKALVSAQKKARTSLKDIKIITSIKKVQKPYWFEKFYWFISSDNYLVVGGRDQQQNEIIVKRYMSAGDLYVHADIHGASNVIIKNPTGKSVPLRTLNEAGTMAVCFSAIWEAKILCAAWWVTHDQVSKTAPTGEYLQTGSFMVRGQKNQLLPAQLAMGCGFMFRVSDESAERHRDERKPRVLEGETIVEERLVEESEPDSILNETIEETDEVTLSPEIQVESDQLQLSSSPTMCDTTQTEEDDTIQTGTVAEQMNSLEIDSGTSEDSQSEKGEDFHAEDQSEDDDPVKEGPAEDDPKDDDIVVMRSPQKDNTRVKCKSKHKKGDKKTSATYDGAEEREAKAVSSRGEPAKETHVMKRGHRGKLKKIKEKYKDQDEEEKNLRMAVLKPAGDKKLSKKERKNLKSTNKQIVPSVAKKKDALKSNAEIEDLADPELKVAADLDALSVLTGQPLPDDELLYCVPVVAPYNTLLNYKFKLKLLPGLTKRGKAAKLAVETFLRADHCTQREKDLLKAVDFQKLAVNFPGKVKISVPLSSKKKKSSQSRDAED